MTKPLPYVLPMIAAGAVISLVASLVMLKWDGFTIWAACLVGVTLATWLSHALIRKEVIKPITGALIGVMDVLLSYLFSGIALGLWFVAFSVFQHQSLEWGMLGIVVMAGGMAVMIGLISTGLIAIPVGAYIGYRHVKTRKTTAPLGRSEIFK